MYSNSAKDADDVATFSFHDSRNFGQGFEQVSIFDRPLQSLRDSICNQYKNVPIKVQSLCNEVDSDFHSHFVGKNVKEVLRRLECSGQLNVLSGRKQKSRGGRLTMPNDAVVKIL